MTNGCKMPINQNTTLHWCKGAENERWGLVSIACSLVSLGIFHRALISRQCFSKCTEIRRSQRRLISIEWQIHFVWWKTSSSEWTLPCGDANNLNQEDFKLCIPCMHMRVCTHTHAHTHSFSLALEHTLGHSERWVCVQSYSHWNQCRTSHFTSTRQNLAL